MKISENGQLWRELWSGEVKSRFGAKFKFFGGKFFWFPKRGKAPP